MSIAVLERYGFTEARQKGSLKQFRSTRLKYKEFMMRSRNLVAAGVIIVFLFTVTGFCAGDGKVTMEQWNKIIRPKGDILPIATGETNPAQVSDGVAALLQEAERLMRSQEHRKLLDVAERIIEQSPNNSEGYRFRGNARRYLKDLKGANDDYGRAIELAPDNERAWNGRAQIKVLQGNFEGALADLTHALEVNPNYHAGLDARALIYHELKEYRKSIADSSKAIELAPDNQLYLVRRGSALEKINDFKGALEDFEAALNKSPNYGYALNGRGSVLTSLGRPEEAIQEHTKALMNGHSPDYTLTLRGKAYLSKGMNAEAANDFAQALQKNPKSTEAAKLLAQLRSADGATYAAETEKRPMSGISQQQLIEAVKTFRVEAIIGPIAALKKFSSISTLQDFTEIENVLFTETPPDIGWKYYFATATYTVVTLTEQTYVALFYHPWSDTAIMTLWQYGNEQCVMTHAELVLGDYIRQYGRTPFEVQPLWERESATITPLLALPLAVGETLVAFENIFPVSGKVENGSYFAQQRRSFDNNKENKEIRENMLTAANLRFERGITALIRYEQDKELEVYRDYTSFLLAAIKMGDFRELEVTIPQTSQMTFDLIKANNKIIGLFKVVSVLKTPTDWFVFLSHPADPNNVLVLWFQADSGKYGLYQAYFINHIFSASYVSQIRDLVKQVGQP